ncbi:lipopeptide [Vibrio albus]|uniref:Lipopeptide n=1 Tax=Vibrio albus TaxID=2200953 RepID=A0A2U3B5B8_9VIBR|nr:lipoprotein [Vibrio albus]PWI31905.1 lipopeptide [Vibrio albus]
MVKFSVIHPLCPIAFLIGSAIIGGIGLLITTCTNKTMKKTLAALCLLSVLGLTGCGQTGPLYMPDDNAQSEQTESQ